MTTLGTYRFRVFRRGNDAEGRLFAVTAHRLIEEVNCADPVGWIIDLRFDHGGNMWPMLLAVGPFLGSGSVGSCVRLDGHREEWSYSNGRVALGDRVIVELGDAPCELRNPSTSVAVLIGEGTASAGEAIAASFRGRPGTRFFGSPTAGLSTGIEQFVLSDGAKIFLATCAFADRHGKVIEGSISPEETVWGTAVPPDALEEDRVVRAAVTWLILRARRATAHAESIGVRR